MIMNKREEILLIIRSLTGEANLLTIPTLFVEYTGSLDAALLLNQILYWSDRGTPDGWFWKTYEQWKAEIYLSEYEVRKATRVLIEKEAVVTQLRPRGPRSPSPTLHYAVHPNFSGSIVQFLQVRALNNSTIEPLESEGSYNTETTGIDYYKEEGPLYTGAPAQSSLVEGPPSMGTGKKVPGAGNSKAVGGKQKMDLTLPPTKYRVSTEMWEWAQRAGWRASREDLQFTADTCFDHFRGKGEARADWIATLRTWVSRNIEEGKDLKIMQRQAAIQNIENGGSNGRAGPGGQDRPRYGYNRAGEPTNRSTAIIETARSLARTQAARELETGGPEYVETQRTREDRLRDSPGTGQQLRGDIDESDR